MFFFPNEDGDIEYTFKGEFTHKREIVLRFSPVDSSIYDKGVAFFALNNMGDKLEGGSVSYNLDKGKIEPRRITVEKVSPNCRPSIHRRQHLYNRTFNRS
ncbi:hypothetical protein D6833_01115 [Candidatus Parcubacteria bacterium]|nr:MAG: hypothetical protein D6833_01115 [Candidatus Parcubacteria bacterium]